MAKVKFSALVSGMSGKLNGSVLFKGRNGDVIRTKVTPVNPNTTAQSLVRSVLAYLSSKFRTLTQAQIAAWNSAVANFAKTDIFGDLRNPTGLQLYVKLNANLANVGAAYIAVPPNINDAASGAAGLDELTVSSDVSDTEMIVGRGATVPAGMALVIEATAPQSAGRNFVKSQFRKIKSLAAAVVDDTDIWADYVAKFGAPAAGDKVFIRAYYTNITSGLKSQPLQASCIVTA